jgi:hypothetical protein
VSLLKTVTVWAVLLVPTACVPKLSEVGSIVGGIDVDAPLRTGAPATTAASVAASAIPAIRP